VANLDGQIGHGRFAAAGAALAGHGKLTQLLPHQLGLQSLCHCHMLEVTAANDNGTCSSSPLCMLRLLDQTRSSLQEGLQPSRGVSNKACKHRLSKTCAAQQQVDSHF